MNCKGFLTLQQLLIIENKNSFSTDRKTRENLTIVIRCERCNEKMF
jgi:hypothetical protein